MRGWFTPLNAAAGSRAARGHPLGRTARISPKPRLPSWGMEEKRAHKAADIAAAAAEAVYVAGWTEAEMRETLGIRAALLARDPLAARYGGEPWRPWPPALAAERFLDELSQLQAKAD